MRLHAIQSKILLIKKNTEITDSLLTLLSLKRQGFGDYSSATHLAVQRDQTIFAYAA